MEVCRGTRVAWRQLLDANGIKEGPIEYSGNFVFGQDCLSIAKIISCKQKPRSNNNQVIVGDDATYGTGLR